MVMNETKFLNTIGYINYIPKWALFDKIYMAGISLWFQGCEENSYLSFYAEYGKNITFFKDRVKTYR